MTALKFSDGVSVETGGELRVQHLSDGWYVTGRGMLLPVDSPGTGEALIARLSPAPKPKPKAEVPAGDSAGLCGILVGAHCRDHNLRDPGSRLCQTCQPGGR